jgi:hypothetical protein
MSVGFLGMIILLAAVVLAIQLYQRRATKTASGHDKPLGDALRDEAGRVARGAGDTLQGNHGRIWQVLAIIVIVILGFRLGGVRGEPSTLLYGIMFLACGYLVYRFFVPAAYSHTSSRPVPPPLPPEARAVREPESLQRVPRRHIGPLKFVIFALAPLAFIVLLFLGFVFLGTSAPRGMRMMFIPQGREILERIEADEDFDPSELVVRSSDIQRVADVPTPAPPSAPKVPDAAPPPTPPVMTTNEITATKLHKSSTGVELASLTTEAYPSEAEARQGAMLLASRYLSQVIQQKGLIYTDWRPSLSWTSRNFIESLEIEKVERGDLSVFVGHADVRVPDEKKVEQIWNEFVKDKAAGRSLLLVKIFAGAVFMAGGFAVLLRLGTGRHVAQEPVSLKKRLFGQNEPANR